VSENVTITGLVFAPKIWVETNCGCDLFHSFGFLNSQSLDSEVKHSAST